MSTFLDEQESPQPHLRRAAEEYLRGEGTVREHPDIDLLVLYQEGELEESLAEEVRVHISDCSECASELESMEAFAPDIAEDPNLLPSPEMTAQDWKALTERLEMNTPPSSSSVDPHRKGTSFAPLPARCEFPPMNLLAASLTALGLAAGLLLWLHGPEPSGPGGMAIKDLQHLVILDLVADQDGQERSGASQPIQMSVETDLLILRLIVSDLTPYEFFRVGVFDKEGNVVWTKEGLKRQPTGEILLPLPAAKLPTGGGHVELLASSESGPLIQMTYRFVTVPPSGSK